MRKAGHFIDNPFSLGSLTFISSFYQCINFKMRVSSSSFVSNCLDYNQGLSSTNSNWTDLMILSLLFDLEGKLKRTERSEEFSYDKWYLCSHHIGGHFVHHAFLPLTRFVGCVVSVKWFNHSALASSFLNWENHSTTLILVILF